MAEQQTLRWVKSSGWKIISASGAAVGGIGGPDGMRIVIRFTSEWADIESETFTAEIGPAPGRVEPGTVAIIAMGAPSFQIAPLVKMEEIAVKIAPDVAGGLITALLAQFVFFSPQQQQAIRDAVASLPKA